MDQMPGVGTGFYFFTPVTKSTRLVFLTQHRPKKTREFHRRKMTLFHFGNCVALAYVPFVLVYKCSGL